MAISKSDFAPLTSPPFRAAMPLFTSSLLVGAVGPASSGFADVLPDAPGPGVADLPDAGPVDDPAPSVGVVGGLPLLPPHAPTTAPPHASAATIAKVEILTSFEFMRPSPSE